MRFSINFPVGLRLGGEAAANDFAVECLNLSLKGMEIDCNSALVGALQQLDCYPPVCWLDFELPGDAHHFSIKAQVLSFRRLSLHHYHIALIYPDMPAESAAVMEAYLRRYRLGDYEYRSLLQAGVGFS